MEIAIIIFVVLSLIGSAMWMMPTAREKAQANIRLRARQQGFQVQLVRLTAPRALGELDEETTTIPGYRLLRTRIEPNQETSESVWQVFRVASLANTGLPSGWSWKRGERMLSDDHLQLVGEVLEQLPTDVVAVESTPIQVTAFWREEGSGDALDVIKTQLNRLLEARI